MVESMGKDIGSQALQALQGMRGDITHLSGQMQVMNQRLEDLTKRVEVLTERVDVLTTHVDDLTTRVVKLEGWMERLATKLMEARAEVHAVRIQLQ